MNGQVDTEQILDAFLAPEADRLPDRVIDAALADIDRTPQRRAPRVPWRLPHMPALTRATGIAAVALVTVVAAGGAIYLDSRRPGGLGGQPTLRPSPMPTASPTPGRSEVAPGISGWKTYVSGVHRFTLGYPEDWSVATPATREWEAGDEFPADALPFADVFVSPGEGDDQIGLFVWDMPGGEGSDIDADLESTEGWKAWAETFCTDVGASDCDAFTEQARPMCQNAGGDPCRAALLVPTPGAQYGFFLDWETAMLVGLPDRVRVVVVARQGDFPAAARYGGSVELLKSILTTMNVR